MKKTAIAQVAIKFMKQTAKANTLDLNHIFPSSISLFRDSTQLMTANITSIVLFFRLVIIIDARITISPQKTVTNMNRNENDKI